MPWARHVYHTYTICTEQRDALQSHLEARGIGTAVHYRTPVHLQPAYSDLGWGPGSLPEAERAAREVLSLPMFAEMTDEMVAAVAAAVGDFRGIP
jgi:dTDP-4-amino-4,6-dideoxygalactose transaminase